MNDFPRFFKGDLIIFKDDQITFVILRDLLKEDQFRVCRRA